MDRFRRVRDDLVRQVGEFVRDRPIAQQVGTGRMIRLISQVSVFGQKSKADREKLVTHLVQRGKEKDRRRGSSSSFPWYFNRG